MRNCTRVVAISTTVVLGSEYCPLLLLLLDDGAMPNENRLRMNKRNALDWICEMVSSSWMLGMEWNRD